MVASAEHVKCGLVTVDWDCSVTSLGLLLELKNWDGSLHQTRCDSKCQLIVNDTDGVLPVRSCRRARGSER